MVTFLVAFGHSKAINKAQRTQFAGTKIHQAKRDICE
jgi:hypothetical protein